MKKKLSKKEKIIRSAVRGLKKVETYGRKKAKSKRILSKGRVVVKIHTPVSAPYVSRYFKQEVEQARSDLFFD